MNKILWCFISGIISFGSAIKRRAVELINEMHAGGEGVSRYFRFNYLLSWRADRYSRTMEAYEVQAIMTRWLMKPFSPTRHIMLLSITTVASKYADKEMADVDAHRPDDTRRGRSRRMLAIRHARCRWMPFTPIARHRRFCLWNLEPWRPSVMPPPPYGDNLALYDECRLLKSSGGRFSSPHRRFRLARQYRVPAIKLMKLRLLIDAMLLAAPCGVNVLWCK